MSIRRPRTFHAWAPTKPLEVCIRERRDPPTRPLTRPEIEALAGRLGSLGFLARRRSRLPVERLVECLHNPRLGETHRVEEADGQPVAYHVGYASSSQSWQAMCGRAGVYRIDAASLRSLGFRLTSLN